MLYWVMRIFPAMKQAANISAHRSADAATAFGKAHLRSTVFPTSSLSMTAPITCMVETEALVAVSGMPAVRKIVLFFNSKVRTEQYPGNMQVTATYTWDDTNTLTIAYDAICDQDTLCNLTNHTYFQLDGEGSGSIEKQQLLVRANAYLPTDPTSIPTGEIAPVAETPFDFTAYRSIGEALEGKHEQLTYASGIDHSYVVDSHAPFQAAAYSAESGIGLTCTTTQPAVHVYTGNFVHVPESLGKNGHRYTARSGFCLETQNYPDAIHHPNFPTPILPANTPYRQVTTFHFSLGREEA